MTQVKRLKSKKTKGSWRKIDHPDVENFLEDQRLEERIGKASEKTNDELFMVDTEPKQKKKKSKKTGLTLREKRKQLLESTPKCFSALINQSKVQDPIVKRNRVRTKEERKHFIAKSIDLVKANKGIVQKKILTSLADRARSLAEAEEKRKANKKKAFDKDIWEEGTPAEKRTDFRSEWIDKHVENYHIVNTGTPVVSVPRSAYHKRSKLKAIQMPHPGTSYNPTFSDHQSLLAEVKKRELQIIKQEEHLERVTTAMYNKVPSYDRDIAKLKELRSGMDDDEEEDEDKSDHEDEYFAVNPPVEVKRKDRKARRKQKEQRLLQQIQLQKKSLKKQKADLNQLKKLSVEVKLMENELAEQRAKKKEREEKKREEPHRLSKYEFEEAEIDANMPEEIAGNLRNIEPQGNILKDRYKSMQRRNIIATSKDLGLRKRREVKRYTRNSHKEELPQPQKGNKKKKTTTLKH